MGLENLKSVFNDLSENTLPEKGIHGGLTNERPSTPAHSEEHSLLDFLPNVPLLGPDNQSMSPTLESRGRHGDLIIKKSGQKEVDKPHSDNHSELDNIEENRATKLDLQTNSTAGKIVFPDNGSVDYAPLVSDKIGPSVGLNTFSQLLDENINKRSFDPSTLGKDQALGSGQYTLETLYLNNHRGSPERIQIDTGKKDWKGNAITINTGRAGMGALSNLDIKGYSSWYRNGIGFLKEPYIVHNIPETGLGSFGQGVGQNRDFIPFRAALDDVSRLAQFYTSPAGIAFMLKENITNQLIGSVPSNDIKPRPLSIQVGGDLNALNKILLPPAPNPIQGNTGFLNFTNQFRDLGSQIASLRKPFLVEYSKRHTLKLPFGFLGDNVPPSFFDGERLIEYPHFKKPRFLGLGQGPKWKNNDKISDMGIEESLFNDFDFTGDYDINDTYVQNETLDTQKGDFYVRIRDLRDGKYIYFRGYVTGITENVNPSFTPTNYIGRSEPVYQYERAERDLSFNLRVYPANAIELNMMYEKIEKLTSLAYPEYLPETDNKSLVRMKAPFTELYMAHIGSRVKGQFGFIKSLSYTVNDSGDWDALSALPRLFDISISYQILSKRPPSLRNGSLNTNKFYGAGA